MLFKLPSLAYALALIILMILSKDFAQVKKAVSANNPDANLGGSDAHLATDPTYQKANQEDNQAAQQVTQQISNHFWLRQNRKNILFHLAVFILLVLHGVVCFLDVATPAGLVFGFAQALSLMAWVGVALYWIEGWFFNIRGMLPMILTIGMVSSFLPVIYEGSVIARSTVYSHGFVLHFITANIAYGVLFLAAIQAILIGWQERNLRSQFSGGASIKPGISSFLLLGQKKAFLEQLPPLLTMEKILFNVISIGFVLLTIAVFSGIFFSQELFGKPLIFDHKIFFSILSWLMFGGVLFANWQFGLRGSQALKWILVSFGVLLFSYIGSRFVLEVILHR